MKFDTYIPDKNASVACGTCRLCCRRALIPLVNGEDNESDYQTKIMPDGLVVLAHKPNGDCIYLDDATGCTIHGRAPIICRTYSCVEHYKSLTGGQQRAAIRQRLISKEVLHAGRIRASADLGEA